MKRKLSTIAVMFLSMAFTLHLTDQVARHTQETTPSESTRVSERCADYADVWALPTAGLGALVECEPKGIRLVTSLPGHAGELAGLQVGDRIIAIDGESTYGCNIAWAVSRLRGKIGTSVVLDVERGEGIWQRSFRTQVERRSIDTDHSVYSRLRGTELTIKLLWLGPDTPAQLVKHLAQASSGDMDSVILDLSSLSSGDLNSLKSVASLLLPENATIGYYGHPGVDGEWEALELRAEGYQFSDQVTTVKVGQYTAGPGELLARALADNLSVKVIGEKTAGLGTLDNRTVRSRSKASPSSIKLFDKAHKAIDGNPLSPDFFTWSSLLSPVGAGLE